MTTLVFGKFKKFCKGFGVAYIANVILFLSGLLLAPDEQVDLWVAPWALIIGPIVILVLWSLSIGVLIEDFVGKTYNQRAGIAGMLYYLLVYIVFRLHLSFFVPALTYYLLCGFVVFAVWTFYYFYRPAKKVTRIN